MKALLLTGSDDLPERERVWGRPDLGQATDQREALTWLSLVRLLGWRATIARGPEPLQPTPEHRCVIVATDPGAVGKADCDAIASHLERTPALVIARAAPPEAPLARLAGTSRSGGERVTGEPSWSGPGEPRIWRSQPSVWIDALEGGAGRLGRLLGRGADDWASIGKRPLAVARRVGRGTVVSLAAHPSELAGAAPSGSGVLAHMLRWGVPAPSSWLDLDGTVVLRMDDPGSAAAAHLDPWAHELPSDADWARIAGELERRRARISIGYVAGWLDDGDPERGELEVGGERVERIAGTVHPSHQVVYRSRAGLVHDHPAELRGLVELRRRQVGELEVHGYTHVRPDPGGPPRYSGWARAPDRHESVAWYRELEGFRREGEGPDPVGNGTTAIDALTGRRPTTLACPGQVCSPDAVECAIDAGLSLVATEALAIRSGDRMVWGEHVRSPYLDGGDGPWLEAGVPVVGCFHDRDVAGNPEWLHARLDEWTANGCRRFWDFRQLAAALALEVTADGVTQGAPEPVAPVPIATRHADGHLERSDYEPARPLQ